MNKKVNVFELNTIENSMKIFYRATQDIEEQCNKAIYNTEKVLQETQDELHISEIMLEAAKAKEAICLAKKIDLEARMIHALTNEATAISSGNPVAIAAASAYVAQITVELAQATEEYNQAVYHRERLEYRYELAVKCVNIAQEMCETLKIKFNYFKSQIFNDTEIGISRLQNAYNDLYRYLSRVSPEALSRWENWEKWEPKENEPTTPDNIRDRLNVDNSVINSIIEYLYATDLNFKISIDNLRIQIKNLDNEDAVKTKIKRNITGRVCEEIVIRAFTPMGQKIKTQERFYLDDGSYTKVDMILYGLKSPLILGRGEGMASREGGNLGIEVKSGNKEYIYSQMEHMEKQAQGHKTCDLSCTICTRDIKDLSPQREAKLRDRMREAGSPILGMLPRKSQIDEECIRFVKKEEN